MSIVSLKAQGYKVVLVEDVIYVFNQNNVCVYCLPNWDWDKA